MNVTLYCKLMEIYQHMQDEESKQIFCNRAMHSLSGDIKYLDLYIKKLPERWYLDDKSLRGGYIFGCGFYGRSLHDYIKKNWISFVDNNQKLWGTKCCGLDVISPKEITMGEKVYIAVKYHGEKIKKQLLQLGVVEENIIDVAKILIDMGNRQYFDLPELQHEMEEVFVDAGCLNGITTKNFIKWAKNTYKKIYCFEPDPYSAQVCHDELQYLVEANKAVIINKAVTEKNGVIGFSSYKNGYSHIGDGDIKVEAVALDDVLRNEKVTFIKMDIEGAEYEALNGARRIICEQRPKLAISVYHKKDDIYDIPELLLSYHPDYRFYLRHYSPFYEETILYAI